MGRATPWDARTPLPFDVPVRQRRLKAGIAEANPVRIGEQHHAVQLERVEGVSQLIQSAINVWQRQGGKTAQPVRMRLHQLRRELVASARERPRARIVPDVDARVESR